MFTKNAIKVRGNTECPNTEDKMKSTTIKWQQFTVTIDALAQGTGTHIQTHTTRGS